MKYALLRYHLIEDYIEKRTAYRVEHFELVRKYFEKGQIIMGGALSKPADEALIIFKGEDSEVQAKTFAAQDPYVLHQLVINWEIRPWNVAIGA